MVHRREQSETMITDHGSVYTAPHLMHLIEDHRWRSYPRSAVDDVQIEVLCTAIQRHVRTKPYPVAKTAADLRRVFKSL